jgi:transcriptional regulator with PAS, ATPase and Fis domain
VDEDVYELFTHYSWPGNVRIEDCGTAEVIYLDF